MAKIGRNQPCPCGSGVKYKKCCGKPQTFASPSGQPEEQELEVVRQKLRQAEAERIQREKQQGLGRGIISEDVHGQRIVAVGSRVYHSKQWKTFHDFLRDYLIDAVGREWFETERAKADDQRHLILRWFDQAIADHRRHGEQFGEMVVSPMTGAQRAFLNLAYNLYLIDHHAEPEQSAPLLETFVDKLKSERSDDFIGKLFETYAAAAFLKAGFTLVYEDESDGRSSHVEFVATYPATGKKFSVEVKSRNRLAAEDGPVDEIKRLRVGAKLNKALTKTASHTRVVMIEINVPDVLTDKSLTGWPQAALDQIRQAEKNDWQDGTAKPSAYVMVTNHAFHNNLAATGAGAQVLAAGCRIPDFGPDVEFNGFKAVLESKERHQEIYSLLESMGTHYEIPATFDGQIPELAFQTPASVPPLKLGQWYAVPAKDGRAVPGLLEEATVMESKKTVYGVYKTSEGERILVTSPMTDAEIVAWKRHPDTFFGEVRHVGGNAENWLELCEFLYETYQNTSREVLLEWMKEASDIEEMKKQSQKDLAIKYCEGIALAHFKQT